MIDTIFDIATNILPIPPSGTPAEIASSGLEFFEKWIYRIGGIIAFVGAVKLALSAKGDDEKEQLLSVFIMVSGFMIQSAIKELNVFDVTTGSYTSAQADIAFNSLMTFASKWVKRVGRFGVLIGAIMFGIAVKENNATTKVNAVRALAVGSMVTAIGAILTSFV